MGYFTIYASPIGNLLLLSDGNALTGLYLEPQLPPEDIGMQQNELPLFLSVRAWLNGYFSGEKPAVTFPLLPTGTAFQQQVWKMLRTIPYGETVSYGQLARQLSSTMSAQAIGGAVGKNPISIIIPCHRCLGARGQLTGYAGGLQNKQWLLRHEEETK